MEFISNYKIPALNFEYSLGSLASGKFEDLRLSGASFQISLYHVSELHFLPILDPDVDIGHLP